MWVYFHATKFSLSAALVKQLVLDFFFGFWLSPTLWKLRGFESSDLSQVSMFVLMLSQLDFLVIIDFCRLHCRKRSWCCGEIERKRGQLVGKCGDFLDVCDLCRPNNIVSITGIWRRWDGYSWYMNSSDYFYEGDGYGYEGCMSYFENFAKF